MGLTSVASLSLSLSMSMSGGVLNMARVNNPMLNRRESQGFLQAGPRKPNLALGRPTDIIQNHVRGGDKTPTTGKFAKKVSMEKVIEESPTEDLAKKSTVKEAETPMIIEEKPKKAVTIIEMQSTKIEPPPPPPQTIPSTSILTKTVIVEQKNGVGQKAKTPPPILKKPHKTPSPILKKPSRTASPTLRKSPRIPSSILKRPSSPRIHLRTRSPSPKKSRSPSPVSGVKKKIPPPYRPRKSKSPSPRPSPKQSDKDQQWVMEKEMASSNGNKAAKRRERPRSSVTFEFENELGTTGPPPRRAVSSETVVVANGPLNRGSASPRGSKEDIVVRLQRQMGSTSTDDKVTETKTVYNF